MPGFLFFRFSFAAPHEGGDAEVNETPEVPDHGKPSAFVSLKIREDHGELIEAIIAGERYAMARAYDLFSKPLYGLAMRLLKNREEAEDIVHDVFIHLRDHAEDFDARRGGLFPWLLMITRSRVVDRIRKTRRRAELVAEAAPADLGWDEGASEPPPAAAEGAERAVTVRQALQELTQEDRKALELAYFTGLSQPEIAERLQEPLGTVKSRIRRSLLKLREILGGRL